MPNEQNRLALPDQVMELKASLEQERNRRCLLENAIESLDDGFLLCDKDDRLVYCNSKYQQLYRLSEHTTRPGTPFEEIIRETAYKGGKKDAIGREEEWIAERLALRGQEDHTFEQELSGGRWLKNSDRKTCDGGIVGLQVDITRIRQAELSFRRHKEYLSTLHEMSLGIINRKNLSQLLESIVKRAAPLAGTESRARNRN